MNCMYRIYGTVCFPEGIATSEGNSGSNILPIARNGKNEAVVRGTTLAGLLRNHFLIASNKDFTNQWFGEALDGKEERASKIKVHDVVLGKGSCKITMERTHNMVNRHTGVVVKNGLFSVESVVPGASGVFCLYIKADADDSEKCIETLSKVLGNSLTIGGNRNRGMGRIEFKNLESCRFNLDNAEDYADWLSTRYADAKGLHYTPKKNSRFEATEDTSVLKLKLDIGIPRGEDFVIGYGETLDGLLADPQFVRKIDGKEYWCIPGSSFRGVVKGWMSRLAAKEGFILKDSHDHWNENRKSFKGDELGWGFVGKDERENFKKNPTLLKDPILELFGSLYKRGRIHFSDAYSKEPRKDSDTQLRKHVSIDRFSGGANDGALFSNKVLVGNVKFSMDVSISRKSFDGKDVDADQWKKEITWLKKTFRAINQGIISFGSSKGSGLLEITNLEEINKQLEREG